jgi:hypothetical protein
METPTLANHVWKQRPKAAQKEREKAPLSLEVACGMLKPATVLA